MRNLSITSAGIGESPASHRLTSPQSPFAIRTASAVALPLEFGFPALKSLSLAHRALPATAASCSSVNVVWVSSGTMSFTGIGGGQIVAPHDVDATRNRLQMTRIHTPSIATKVIQGQPIRDRPDEILIGKSMGARFSLLFSAGPGQLE